MKLPWVSRDSYDGARRLAESERENAQHLRREVIDLGAAHSAEIAKVRHLYSEALDASTDLTHSLDEWRKETSRLREDIGKAEAFAETCRQAWGNADKNAVHWQSECARLGEFLSQERKRYDDLMARYHEATSRTADALDTVIKPAPVQVNAPVPDFQSFPPIVAGALALANAGFPKDIQRANYIWAEAQLKSGMKPDQVAAELRHGVPVNTDMSEYPD